MFTASAGYTVLYSDHTGVLYRNLVNQICPMTVGNMIWDIAFSCREIVDLAVKYNRVLVFEHYIDTHKDNELVRLP